MSAYREWDRGKDSGSSWDNQAGGGRVRPREQDYGYDHGEKRRKFNNGGYDSSAYANDSSYDTANASFGGKKRLQPSEPSPHVIFLGLEPDFTESDLQAFLSGHGCTTETVTIIRERSSGQSKGFGFAQFPSTEHAKVFVGPNFPFVHIPPPASHGATARSAFYKALESGTAHNGRRVKIDYSQSASPHERKTARGNTNDGTRDIGNGQSSVLLLRGLDPLSGPQAINQAMRNSAGSGKDGAKGMKRIILIKEKSTLASYGFAFVEFVDPTSAATALGNTMSIQAHPNGFRISDTPIAASFANAHSFQPVADVMQRDEACLQSSAALGGAEGSFVRYWDENTTVSVLEFKVETPASTTAASKEKKEKKKHKAEEPVLRPIALAPSTLPVSDKPIALNLNKGVKIPLGAAKTVQSSAFAMQDVDEDPVPRNEPNKPHAVSRVGPMMGGRKIVGNINKWNQVQEHMSEKTQQQPSAKPRPSTTSALPASAAPTKAMTTTSSSSAPAAFQEDLEFADTNALNCLLCSRKFNSLDILRRHSKESELHKKNLQDPKLQEAARIKVAKAQAAVEAEHPKYRDRASERRTLFKQPDHPLPETSRGGDRQVASAIPRAPTPPPAAPLNPGEDANNVGNKLLKMMGWTEGTGLGSSAEGRVNPIETAIYAQGAGLGASKGKELGKYAQAGGSYVSLAQDTARERFNGAGP